MTSLLESYEPLVGAETLAELAQTAEPLRGKKLIHVNSTREGGGVAEILHRMQPLMADLGIASTWEVIEGDAPFFDVTKGFHNGLQGMPVDLDEEMLRAYRETNARNAERLRPRLEAADVVIIHDPQPAPQLGLCAGRKGKWIWRCHIDIGNPHPPVWEALRPFVAGYDASIYHMQEYAPKLDHLQAIIPPSIDPLSDKNVELPAQDVDRVFAEFGLDRGRPLVVQVSRFDRFKDPAGVVEAYRLAREQVDLQLVLAGGSATDDPEGAEVLAEVRAKAGDDPDIHLLLLPPDAHRVVNALQRAADIVIQKSLREGFGLTVTEAMWKGKPVLGGDAGGIRLQIKDGETGYLVASVNQCAARIVELLNDREASRAMGETAHDHVRKNFLLTRHTRDYLALAAQLIGS